MTTIPKIIQEDFDYTLSQLTELEKSKMAGATILITGCGGFLGYYFMRFFQAKALELSLKKVIGLDNFILGYPLWLKDLSEDPLFDIQKFDIIKDDIGGVCGAEDASYIIHMASIASPMYYRKYPIETLDANVWGLRSLLDYYRGREIKGFLYFSSSELYGDPDPSHVPTDEEYYGYVCTVGPRSCYDESKRFGETLCMLYSQKYGMPIGIARPFNNYGPGMRINDKRVVADFALAVMENRDIEIFSDGSPTRTFCYIADSVAGYLKILLHGDFGYYNIGIESPEISIRQLAQIFVSAGSELTGYKGDVVFAVSEDKSYLTNNPQRRCPCIAKARRELGYSPTISVEQGIRRYLVFLAETLLKTRI